MKLELACLAAAALGLGAACASHPARPAPAPASQRSPPADGGGPHAPAAPPSPSEPGASPGESGTSPSEPGASPSEPGTSPDETGPAPGEDADVAPRPPPDDAALRAAVAAAAPDGPDPRGGRASRALLLVADALDALARGEPARRAVNALREEVAAIQQLARVDLERADRLKGALARGVDALRAIADDRSAGGLEPWVDAAGAAVGQLDPAVPLGLQRAVAQDALRALVDAVLRARELEGR